MALIVGVHGIAQQGKGAPKLVSEWWPSLLSGVDNAGRKIPDNSLACAYYGGLFRGRDKVRAAGDPPFIPADVKDPFEKVLLLEWWKAAAADDPSHVPAPKAAGQRGVPVLVQDGLQALTHSKFFVGIARSLMIGNLKQVRLYMQDNIIRTAAQDSVNAVVATDTKVLVAHSLGSVVAYESLHRFKGQPNWANVKTLITLGSPLAIQNLIFQALDPAPVNGKGEWPPHIERWVNISDDHDVVALNKKLGDFFDGKDGTIVDIGIDNGATAHDVSPYLTAISTGKAIADAIA
ncbi:MAG: hypothetical protein AABM64_03560 [Pseudomonadota bacterium]